MIASIAIRTGAEVLAADRNFADMARVLPLRLAWTTPSALLP